MTLKDKTAIVTGAASGIGKAIAKAFADEGADVAILDINQAKADEVVADIQKKGRRACFVPCDVGYADQAQRAFAEAVKFLRRLDILVNNTGIIRFAKIVDMPEADWDLILRTNLKSVFLCSQQAARQMIQQGGGGRIIAISSIHAVLSEPNCGHYTAAKGGMESFCRTLATELAPHKITVNYIRPGATYTELTVPMYTPAVKRALFERVPEGLEKEPLTYSSPVATEEFERVERLRSVQLKLTRTATGYIAEVAIPWSELHRVPPSAGLSLPGDVGVLLSDQSGTRTVLRRYLFNRDTNIVDDIPSESRIIPKNWGRLAFD